MEKTASFELYVKDQEEAQSALSLTDEPAFMSAEMESKLSKYEKEMAAAMAKKPKPKKAKKTKKRKAKRVSTIAKGRMAKSQVLKGRKAKTVGETCTCAASLTCHHY